MLFVALLLIGLPVGCDDVLWCDCDYEMYECKEEYGEPEEIIQTDTNTYHYRAYWYWCKGFAKTFEWGEDVPLCCAEKTTYFDPVCD